MSVGGSGEIRTVPMYLWIVAAVMIALSGATEDDIDGDHPQLQPLFANYSDEFLAEANDYNITNRVLDIFLFTQYCGPSNRIWKQTARATPQNRVTYADLNECCRQHDNCENYIEDTGDYERYPGLPQKRQIFTRMQCMCDGLFYKCLSELNSRYASAVAIGYGIVQSFCFDFEHPIVKCTKRRFTRCEEYSVDSMQPKIWQWFNVPPAYKKIHDFPRTIND